MPLITGSICTRIQDEVVLIDPMLLYHRISVRTDITKQSEEDLQKHFQYELAPYPLSLFIKVCYEKLQNQYYLNFSIL